MSTVNINMRLDEELIRDATQDVATEIGYAAINAGRDLLEAGE